LWTGAIHKTADGGSQFFQNVGTYLLTIQRKIPEDSYQNFHCCENLKSTKDCSFPSVSRHNGTRKKQQIYFCCDPEQIAVLSETVKGLTVAPRSYCSTATFHFSAQLT
jgi:hypothetical protein